jgi:ribonuclease HI
LEEANFVKWWQTQRKCILFFDGASKRNPGVESTWGVIYDPNGIEKLSFAWGLGHSTNNQVEAMVVYMGLKLINVEQTPGNSL